MELTLKHTVARSGDVSFEQALRETLVPIVKKLYQKDRAGFEKPMYDFVRYLFAAAPFTDKQKLVTIVSEIDQQAGGNMLSLAEHIREESLAEGMSQGMSQGIEEGERRLVLKMLKKGRLNFLKKFLMLINSY